MAVGCSICCQNMASANKIFYGQNVWPWTTKKILTWRVGEYVLACMLYIYIERPFVGNKKRVSTSQCRRQPSLGSITVKSLLWSCWRASTLPHTFLKPQTFLNKGGGGYRATGKPHYLKPLPSHLDLVWMNFEQENKWSLRPCQTFYTFFYFPTNIPTIFWRLFRILLFY